MFSTGDIRVERISEENRLRAGIRSLYRRYQTFQCLRRFRKESIRDLSRLTDHQLDDIGLSRAHITAIAAGDWFEFEKRVNSKCSVTEIRNQTKQIDAGDHSDQSDDQWKRAA